MSTHSFVFLLTISRETLGDSPSAAISGRLSFGELQNECAFGIPEEKKKKTLQKVYPKK